MIDIRIGNFRIHNITYINDSGAFATKEEKYGLGIEHLGEDQEHYYVVSFIRPYKDEVKLEASSCILDISSNEREDYFKLLAIAFGIVAAAN